MQNEVVGTKIVDLLAAQIERVNVLLMAICAGVIVVLVQISIGDNYQKIVSRTTGIWLIWVIVSIGFVGFVVGWFAQLALVAMVPNLTKIDFFSTSDLSKTDFAGQKTLKGLMRAQLLLLVVAMILLTIFIVLNSPA